MSFENEIITILKNQGADFIFFVDISQLPVEQNRQFSTAILFGITLSVGFIQKIITNPDYVQNIKLNNQIDEFQQKETEADRIADYLAGYLTSLGFSSYSHSEKNLSSSGFYDYKTHSTPLPHKTIARIAGLGWIGKHDLLVTPEFGSAISMCSVLTNAPLQTVDTNPVNSLCGNCTICKNICPVNAISGNAWDIGTSREELVDIYKCITCLKCLAFCPWTETYMKDQLS